MDVLISLTQNFNSNRSYNHLKVAHARNFRRFEFFMVINVDDEKLHSNFEYVL